MNKSIKERVLGIISQGDSESINKALRNLCAKFGVTADPTSKGKNVIGVAIAGQYYNPKRLATYLENL